MNEMVTITRAEYDRLCHAAEDLGDLRAYDRAKAALASGADEPISAEFAKRPIHLPDTTTLRMFSAQRRQFYSRHPLTPLSLSLSKAQARRPRRSWGLSARAPVAK